MQVFTRTAGPALALASPARLAQVVGAIAGQPDQWRPLARFSAKRRWYYRIEPDDPAAGYEVWLLTWLPGQQTGFHDHGDASGAFAVADGELVERTGRAGRADVRSRAFTAGAVRSFGAGHLHDVGNDARSPAVSVHAYAPPLSAMRRYAMTSSGLALAGTEMAGADW
jgi:mannose-6-phosphate isomerase-like protein (cupin superfamily)